MGGREGGREGGGREGGREGGGREGGRVKGNSKEENYFYVHTFQIH